MGRSETRIRRLTEIYKIIESQNKKNGVSKKKLIGECCFTWGADRRKVLEYINIMIDAERVIDIEGVLWIKK